MDPARIPLREAYVPDPTVGRGSRNEPRIEEQMVKIDTLFNPKQTRTNSKEKPLKPLPDAHSPVRDEAQSPVKPNASMFRQSYSNTDVKKSVLDSRKR